MKFNQLTPAKQRVAIAKDVIASLKEEKVRATSGETLLIADSFAKKLEVAKELQPQLKKVDGHCRACAIGAAFLSAVRLGNDFLVSSRLGAQCGLVGGYAGMETAAPILIKYFEKDTIGLIENAFEEGEGAYAWLCHPYKQDAIAFGKKFKSPKARLIAIMENIVKNKGDLVFPNSQKSTKVKV